MKFYSNSNKYVCLTELSCFITGKFFHAHITFKNGGELIYSDRSVSK